ncbi:repeatdomain containing protein [Pyrenophora tritici-repentis]|nr:repeatdomain containing protein [Pyrenophora tritici-repentis]KAI1598085.1 repeatdomain containing protein [Pyrenophora tritici-repentis]
MALLRRRLRCHYCNVQSRDGVSQIPKTYHCPHCDAVNYFDQRGNITDPPIEEIATAPTTSFQYMRSRSPTPALQAPVDDIFCDMCQRNQTLYTNLLAEFIPEEDDPEYEKYLAAYDDYKVELEIRYPQVCQTCLPRVQDQIRNANHVARADNLARIMEASKNKRTVVQTARQAWTLRIISLAKWMYVSSTVVGMLWHTAALIMAPDDEGMLSNHIFSWDICLSQAILVRSVDEACVLSSSVVKWLQYAIIADLVTIWWNPKLKLKTNSLTGRMHGLKSLWSIRLTVVVLRYASLYYWQHTNINADMFQTFQRTHMVMLGVLALSTVLTWKTVRIVYGAAPAFPKATQETIPISPSSAQKARRNSYHPVHPQADIYDSMAHSFATGIEGYQDSSPCPPSPTLTESSYTTHATDATTPFAKRNAFLDDMDIMDWTPTKGSGNTRFAQQNGGPPEILPNQFAKCPPAAAAQLSPLQFNSPQQPHSIFAQKNPNPFRHRVPAKPPNSLASARKLQQNPWKPSVWEPALAVNKTNFFKEEAKAKIGNGAGGSGVGEVTGLDGLGVPKNVKRDAELFASPKLKYDYYGTMKDTGLEDTFNAMFSK